MIGLFLFRTAVPMHPGQALKKPIGTTEQTHSKRTRFVRHVCVWCAVGVRLVCVCCAFDPNA